MNLQTVRSIGVFGGTFDPIHFGHLILAEHAREELGLEAMLFIPARIPPHKRSGNVISSAEARLHMLQLAIADNPHFAISSFELEREAISYTVDTLEHLRSTFPDSTLTLLIGADNAEEFSTWREPKKISAMASIAIWSRHGSRSVMEILPGTIARQISSPIIEISSTEIRERVATGKSIRYLTPHAVCEYIYANGIYR